MTSRCVFVYSALLMTPIKQQCVIVHSITMYLRLFSSHNKYAGRTKSLPDAIFVFPERLKREENMLGKVYLKTDGRISEKMHLKYEVK